MNTELILWITFYVELFLFIMLLACAPKLLWADFLAVMNIMRVRDLAVLGLGPAPTKWAYRVGIYMLIRAYLLDAFVNLIHMSLWLNEWPRFPKWSRRGQYVKFSAWLLKDGELTVSERLQRHIDTPGSPHRELCLYLQAYWLSSYDTSLRHGIPRQPTQQQGTPA